MENTTHVTDRTGWPSGPWDGEPDRVDFVHAGFSCLILRGPVGSLCGYVGLPESHKLFGMSYHDYDNMPDMDVHGGLTYSNVCSPPICHVPAPRMPEKVWWFGFDCAHAGDQAPEIMEHSIFERHETYRDIAYVRAEVEKLAEQFAAIK